MNLIQKLRTKRKLTQEESASHLGYSRTLITKWETNAVKPNDQQVDALVKFFNVDKIFFTNEKMNEEQKKADRKKKMTTYMSYIQFLIFFSFGKFSVVMVHVYKYDWKYMLMCLAFLIVLFAGLVVDIVVGMNNKKKIYNSQYFELMYLMRHVSRKEYKQIKKLTPNEINKAFKYVVVKSQTLK